MVGLNGFTLCSGIICEELNGSDFVAVPLAVSGDMLGSRITTGYIAKKSVFKQFKHAFDIFRGMLFFCKVTENLILRL